MAHEISSMAFTGEAPWHGLGNQLTEQQPLHVWLKEAGMDWSIQQSDVLFNADSAALNIRSHSDAKVLYRSDSLEPLSGRCSIYVLVNIFTPPNNHDFASLCFCSHTRNHAK